MPVPLASTFYVLLLEKNKNPENSNFSHGVSYLLSFA